MRWRGCGARLVGLQHRMYKLWWSGNQEGYGGVGVVVIEELYGKVVEVRRVRSKESDLSCHSFLRRIGESCMRMCSTWWKID